MASCLANPFIKASVAPLILVALAAVESSDSDRYR